MSTGFMVTASKISSLAVGVTASSPVLMTLATNQRVSVSYMYLGMSAMIITGLEVLKL